MKVLYLRSDYDSLRKDQEYSGYAVYYKRQSDKHAGRDVANFNLFVQLLEIDSRLGSKNEEQLALLLRGPNFMARTIFLHFQNAGR